MVNSWDIMNGMNPRLNIFGKDSLFIIQSLRAERSEARQFFHLQSNVIKLSIGRPSTPLRVKWLPFHSAQGEHEIPSG